MTTSITLEVRTDDPALSKLIEEYNGLPALERMEIEAAIHAWEALRLTRLVGETRGRNSAYARNRRRDKP